MQETTPSVAPKLFQITQYQCTFGGATTLSETHGLHRLHCNSLDYKADLISTTHTEKAKPSSLTGHTELESTTRQKTTVRSAAGLSPTLYDKLISRGTLLKGDYAVRRLTFKREGHTHPSRNANFMTEIWGTGR